jgi:hypothetical protein
MPSLRLPPLHALFIAFGASGCALALGAAVYAGARVSSSGGAADTGSLAASAAPVSATPAYASAMSPLAPAAPPASAAARIAYPSFPALFDPAAPLPPQVFDAPDPARLAGRMDERAALLPVLGSKQILAFYGHPGSRRMGILGLYPKEELAAMIKGYARLYDDANGELGIAPAFYLIYGTCWPEGEIGYLKDSIVREYVDYAREQGMIVFVDHQIGKYGVEDSVRRLLPWLKYPNVHIAIDPEWRTTSPMHEIGQISADELNAAQALVQSYMKEEGIPGTKMLVVHQFNSKMIAEREKVRADYEGVILVHTSDGFGPPELKKGAYSFNSRARNMPVKGFKLFFRSDVEGAGYDEPILTPAQVEALDPRPMVVIYQ